MALRNVCMPPDIREGGLLRGYEELDRGLRKPTTSANWRDNHRLRCCVTMLTSVPDE